MKYPETYLHVEDCRSGHGWIMPIAPDVPLDIGSLVDSWIEAEFCGELERDGEMMPRLTGDYFAQIKLDGEEPETVRCWDSGGFYLK